MAARMTSMPKRLRNEAGAAEIHAAADDRGIVIGRDHDDRHARILRAQIHQAGEAAHARHGEVEHDEIDLAAAFEQLGDLVERPGLRDLDAFEQSGDRLAQRSAKQRVIVGDHQSIMRGCRSRQSGLALSASQRGRTQSTILWSQLLQSAMARRDNSFAPQHRSTAVHCSTTSSRHVRGISPKVVFGGPSHDVTIILQRGAVRDWFYPVRRRSGVTVAAVRAETNRGVRPSQNRQASCGDDVRCDRLIRGGYATMPEPTDNKQTKKPIGARRPT